MSDYRDLNYFFSMAGYLFSAEPLDFSQLQLEVVDSFFYYCVSITEMIRWDMSRTNIDPTPVRESIKQTDMLELFMEYNNADWSELYELYYDDQSAYLAKIEEWKARYNEIAEEIPQIYCYYVSMREVTEAYYIDVLSDPQGTLSESGYEQYLAGTLKYYAPQDGSAYEEGASVTEVDLSYNGETNRSTFGRYTYTNYFGDQMAIYGEYKFGYAVRLGGWLIAGSDQSSNPAIEKDTYTCSYMCSISQGQNAEERKLTTLTLKAIDVFTDSLVSDLEIEKVVVKYVNLLGVTVEQEWDLSTDFSFTARNMTKDDADLCRFCINVTRKCGETFDVKNDWQFFSVITMECEGEVGYLYCTNFIITSKENYRDYYAGAYEGVDICAREKACGETFGSWNSHSYVTESDDCLNWERYVTTGNMMG